jgi:hypothetical protein
MNAHSPKFTSRHGSNLASNDLMRPPLPTPAASHPDDSTTAQKNSSRDACCRTCTSGSSTCRRTNPRCQYTQGYDEHRPCRGTTIWYSARRPRSWSRSPLQPEEVQQARLQAIPENPERGQWNEHEDVRTGGRQEYQLSGRSILHGTLLHSYPSQEQPPRLRPSTSRVCT